MAAIALGLTRPWNRASSAVAGSPGMSRGIRKFTVTAAQRVSTKKPNRCARYLIAAPPCPLSSPPFPAALLRRLQMQQHLLLVRDLPGRGQRVRVVLRRPAGEGAGVVLVPLDALGRRDDRHVPQHGLLDGVQQLVL